MIQYWYAILKWLSRTDCTKYNVLTLLLEFTVKSETQKTPKHRKINFYVRSLRVLFTDQVALQIGITLIPHYHYYLEEGCYKSLFSEITINSAYPYRIPCSGGNANS